MSRRSMKVRRDAVACPNCGGQRYRTVKKGELYRCRSMVEAKDRKWARENYRTHRPCGAEIPGPGGMVAVDG